MHRVAIFQLNKIQQSARSFRDPFSTSSSPYSMRAARKCRRWRVKPGQRKWFIETRYSLSIYPEPNNVKAAVEVSLNVKCCYFSSGSGLWQMPRTFAHSPPTLEQPCTRGRFHVQAALWQIKKITLTQRGEMTSFSLARNISAGWNKSENPIRWARQNTSSHICHRLGAVYVSLGFGFIDILCQWHLFIRLRAIYSTLPWKVIETWRWWRHESTVLHIQL